MLVGAEVYRAKYRHSYTKPEPMVPNQVTPLEWDLRDKYHTFQKGHRIMVQVQSSWFPLIDRNPHKFMDIYAAVARNYMRESGAKKEDLAAVAAKASLHGALNPRAQFRTPRTVEEVLESRLVAEPLTLLMCSSQPPPSINSNSMATQRRCTI